MSVIETDFDELEELASKKPVVSRIHEKWGKSAIAGFQPVPDLLLKHQADLGLTVTDLTVLLNVLMHWWYPEQKPFPRSTTIAKRMGVNVRTVQRSLHHMQELNLIDRISQEDGPTYIDPGQLVDKLSSLAEKDKDYQIRVKKFDVA